MSTERYGIQFPGEEAVFSWLKPDYKAVITFAQTESDRLGHQSVGTEHLLLGLLQEGNSLAAQALGSVGVTSEKVQTEIKKLKGQAPSSSDDNNRFTPEAKLVLEKTLLFYRNVDQSFDNCIGAESLLIALIGNEEELAEETPNTAVQVLQNLGIDLSALRTTIVDLYMQPPLDQQEV